MSKQGQQVVKKPKTSFAKHETFHIREGWLFKGMTAIKDAEKENRLPTIFGDRDAPEQLGIGRNMVRALRFWMQATNLAKVNIEDRQSTLRLTPFGEIVWQHDPYLEDEATLWLIHYHLICNEELATTWYWFFNHFAPVTFDESACFDALSQWVLIKQIDIASSSLKKDVDCLLHTYLTSEKVHTPEDLVESPFLRLGLLSIVSNGHQKRYRLEQLNPERLNPLILLYVLVDRQSKSQQGAYQVGLSKVLREPMNAGRIFNLSTVVLTDLLTTLNRKYPNFRVKFERAGGLDQLNLPDIKPANILFSYYAERNNARKVA